MLRVPGVPRVPSMLRVLETLGVPCSYELHVSLSLREVLYLPFESRLKDRSDW